MLHSIKQILMDRDGLSESDAISLIKEARQALQEYLQEGDQESAFYVCEEWFGLEPDYLHELL